MSHYTALISLAHKPDMGYVIKRGQYIQVSSIAMYTQREIEKMPRYYASMKEYSYLYSHAHTFKTLDEINDYVIV
jgi:hypothetical protein